MDIKKIIYLSCVAASIFSAPLYSCSVHHITIDPRISYETIQMPNHIKPMGVMGIHGLVDFTPWIYGGVGLYSAVSGEKGGYFALALEAGMQHDLISKIALDGGVRVGGGGGNDTPVGGGLFYEPYVGLKYHFNYFSTGLYYSYIHFDTGNINSDQIGLELSAPFHFQYFTTAFDDLSSCHLCLFHDMKHSENYIAALSKAYFPSQDATKLNNTIMHSSIEFLGVELGHFISHHAFLFFNFSGAAHGNDNGYADELLGAGYRFSLLHSAQWSGIAKMAIGSGGGGGINTGGGFIYNPTLGAEYRFNPYFGVEFNGGYIDAPEGKFSAKVAGLLFKYYFSNGTNIADKHLLHLKAWRIRLMNQTYFKPRASSGVDNPTMQLLGFNVDYFISHYFYCTGQTAFAYEGKNTGGYFSGLFGVGAETPMIKQSHVNVFGELLAGTAGGAGLSIGDGALAEPVAGIAYNINHALAVQVSTGYLVALKGQFHSVTLNAGLSYKLWQPK